jgi:hypothetical protein
MAFTLATLKRPPGDTVMYEPAFRNVLETHLQIFRYHPGTQRSDITADKIHQYEGDFFGLLAELGVPMDKHWLYLRVNGMENPNQFGQQLNDPYARRITFTLLSPPDDMIGDLRTLYLSTKDQ